jgi:hypothetical protein
MEMAHFGETPGIQKIGRYPEFLGQKRRLKLWFLAISILP